MDLRKMTMDQLLQPKSGVPWRQAYPEIQRRRGLPDRKKPYDAMSQAEREFFFSDLALVNAPEKPPGAAKTGSAPSAAPPTKKPSAPTVAAPKPRKEIATVKQLEEQIAVLSARADKLVAAAPKAPQMPSCLTERQFAQLVAHEVEQHGRSRGEALEYVTANADALAVRWNFKAADDSRPDTFGFNSHQPLRPVAPRSAASTMTPAEVEKAVLAKSREIAKRDGISVSAASEKLKSEASELYAAYANLR